MTYDLFVSSYPISLVAAGLQRYISFSHTIRPVVAIQCAMLAYLAPKSQFSKDAPEIEDKISEAVSKSFNIKFGQCEYISRGNSVGNAMQNVMRSTLTPDDACIAIEYRQEGRKHRMDFVISGLDEQGKDPSAIIELMKLSDCHAS